MKMEIITEVTIVNKKEEAVKQKEDLLEIQASLKLLKIIQSSNWKICNKTHSIMKPTTQNLLLRSHHFSLVEYLQTLSKSKITRILNQLKILLLLMMKILIMHSMLMREGINLVNIRKCKSKLTIIAILMIDKTYSEIMEVLIATTWTILNWVKLAFH